MRPKKRPLYNETNVPSVSGGKQDNPPDRYDAVPITGNIAVDLAAINEKADQGYRIAGTIPGYVLMGDYKR